MTIKELKEALLDRCPVEYKGMKFTRVVRISFELFREFDNDEDHITYTATLEDKSGRSEITVLGKDVQRCTNSESG
ncbi:MAG: hypothetical protein NC485_14880 [Ruminococcus flavefaciens]|nr:hypothetical protein [Ruminococcus flavefaciens]